MLVLLLRLDKFFKSYCKVYMLYIQYGDSKLAKLRISVKTIMIWTGAFGGYFHTITSCVAKLGYLIKRIEDFFLPNLLAHMLLQTPGNFLAYKVVGKVPTSTFHCPTSRPCLPHHISTFLIQRRFCRCLIFEIFYA